MSARDNTISSRYELKFWLSPEAVGVLRSSIRPFVRHDRFAASRPGGRYEISSLYLDNPALDLYRTTTEGHRNRFKLRIRSYSDDPQTPVFFEIKRRVDQVVRKRRAPVDRDAAARFLRGQPFQTYPSPPLAEFTQLARRIGAGPVIRVRYLREAFESTGHDPVRVTIDTELAHNETQRTSLSLDGSGWAPTPMEGSILEVKFTGSCPSWVSRTIRALSIERTSVPKYVRCIDAAKARGKLTRSAAQ